LVTRPYGKRYTPGPKNFDARIFGDYSGDRLMYAGPESAEANGSSSGSEWTTSREIAAPQRDINQLRRLVTIDECVLSDFFAQRPSVAGARA
jgi:hypothetical protein